MDQRSAASWRSACRRLVASPPRPLVRSSLGRFSHSAFACLLLLDPSRALLASVFYPIGVSLYSVALVAYPSLLSPAALQSRSEASRQDGSTPSPAGRPLRWELAWARTSATFRLSLCSAPAQLFSSACCTECSAQRTRELVLDVGDACWLRSVCIASGPQARLCLAISGRARQAGVYLRRLHQLPLAIRPPEHARRLDVGTGRESCTKLRSQRPPLIGNRRQGPDLAEVGGRRSPLWLKVHFFNPPEVSGASIMPSYAFLFRDQRGNDLGCLPRKPAWKRARNNTFPRKRSGNPPFRP